MIKVVKKTFPYLLLIIFLIIPLNGFCQQSPIIKKGIDEYKDESYEEAIVTLAQARKEDPGSSVAAFFLGMAYKQTMDYGKALENLLDAVTLAPSSVLIWPLGQRSHQAFPDLTRGSIGLLGCIFM